MAEVSAVFYTIIERSRYRGVDDVWVGLAQPGRERPAVGSAERDYLGALAMLFQDDRFDEFGGVCKGLLRGQVLQVLCGEVREGLGFAVEAVL
eukprot:COSAG06_NODE_769_length_12440_cov_7.241796_1_plen_93_part_00